LDTTFIYDIINESWTQNETSGTELSASTVLVPLYIESYNHDTTLIYLLTQYLIIL